MTNLNHYLNDTIVSIKKDAISDVLSILNQFQGNISFTYEPEINGKFPSLIS